MRVLCALGSCFPWHQCACASLPPPLQWLVGAFGLSALGRLFRGGNRIRPQELAFAGLAGWAFYKQVPPPLAPACLCVCVHLARWACCLPLQQAARSHALCWHLPLRVVVVVLTAGRCS